MAFIFTNAVTAGGCVDRIAKLAKEFLRDLVLNFLLGRPLISSVVARMSSEENVLMEAPLGTKAQKRLL